jgi:ABC-type transport system involved in multi-copper enzyme maturation permease subunit
MAGALFAGLVSIGISLLGKVAFAIGGIMFLTVLVAFAVTLPMFAIAGERKERTRLFVLSLPVSRGDYVLSKVIGVALTFLIPWTVLLLVILTLTLTTPIPDGLVVYATLLATFALADFCVIACSTMLIDREGLQAVVIIFMNMSVTFFIVGVSALTPIGAQASVDAVNWSPTALTILASEIAVIVAAFLFLFWIAGREPEIV